MELGATMELLGEEVSQLWGRRPLYIVGEQTNRYPPPSAPKRAVVPLCAWLFGGEGVTVGLFPPLYKGVFFPKVDLPLSPKAPLLLQAPFSPDLSP